MIRIVFETFLKRVFFGGGYRDFNHHRYCGVSSPRSDPVLLSLFFCGFLLWHPLGTNVALRVGDAAADEDVGGASGSFGMVPVMAGTLLVAVIACRWRCPWVFCNLHGGICLQADARYHQTYA